MNTGTQQGFIILADITGFTPFVLNSELEHSHAILNSILTRIVQFLTPMFTLAEVEGDAVFVYAPYERFERKERILESIESCYAAFRDTRQSLSRMRTCNCIACEMAPSLDLKFVVHFGEYILNDIGGKKKPLGTSVNMAHRLLKNSVKETTGWNAYALFTKECLDAINIDTALFHKASEHIEHIGTVETYSIDLDKVYNDSVKSRRAYLSKEEADVVLERDFPVSPSMLWEWTNDPKKRTKWNPGSDWVSRNRPEGRITIGATNHCVKSGIIEMLQDYRPYQYYTSRIGRNALQLTLTCEFTEIESSTRLSWRVKLHTVLPSPIRRYLCRFMVAKILKTKESFDILYQLVKKEEPVPRGIAVQLH